MPQVLALETTERAKSLFDLDLKADDKIALVVGNEVRWCLYSSHRNEWSREDVVYNIILKEKAAVHGTNLLLSYDIHKKCPLDKN